MSHEDLTVRSRAAFADPEDDRALLEFKCVLKRTGHPGRAFSIKSHRVAESLLSKGFVRLPSRGKAFELVGPPGLSGRRASRLVCHTRQSFRNLERSNSSCS